MTPTEWENQTLRINDTIVAFCEQVLEARKSGPLFCLVPEPGDFEYYSLSKDKLGDGVLEIHTVHYWGGETDHDTIELPLRWVFDSDWESKWIHQLQESRRRWQEEQESKEKARTSEHEARERALYASLKAKYGG